LQFACIPEPYFQMGECHENPTRSISFSIHLRDFCGSSNSRNGSASASETNCHSDRDSANGPAYRDAACEHDWSANSDYDQGGRGKYTSNASDDDGSRLHDAGCARLDSTGKFIANGSVPGTHNHRDGAELADRKYESRPCQYKLDQFKLNQCKLAKSERASPRGHQPGQHSRKRDRRPFADESTGYRRTLSARRRARVKRQA